MYEDSIIIFTSDHGCHFRTRNREYKRSCHEAAIRIPLITKGIGFNGGKIVKELVSLIDILPTLLKARGIEIPNENVGRILKVIEDIGESDLFAERKIGELLCLWIHGLKIGLAGSQNGFGMKLGSFLIEVICYLLV